MSDVSTTPSQRRAGLSIHLLTASGAIIGFLALQSVVTNNIREALVWLVISIIVDGIDGPIARKFDVKVHAPHIDGHVLDLVIDYVTCVVVPVVLMIHADVVPADLATPIAGFILISSALWFARTDQETDDSWFNGFPAMWSIVIPAFIILGTSQSRAAVITVLFGVAQLSSIKFPHVVKVRAMRTATYTAATLYYSAFIYMCVYFPHNSDWARVVLLVGPVYLFAIVIWRTWFPGRTILGRSIVPLDR
jgi:phosphatidylcholine synthase